MTPEQINIAIAESLGYARKEDYIGPFTLKAYPQWNTPDGKVSNYHGSLDACVEMLAAIKPGMWSEFIDNLEYECRVGMGWSEMGHDDRMAMIRHTPQQLTRAYLLTIGQ